MKGEIVIAEPFEIEADLSNAAERFNLSVRRGAETIFAARLNSVSTGLRLK
jgi:hypothetical protein